MPGRRHRDRQGLHRVERLCNVYIPRWLAGEIGAREIAAFYDDPVKTAYDAHSAEKAFDLRALTIDPSLVWSVQRRLRYWARRFTRGPQAPGYVSTLYQ